MKHHADNIECLAWDRSLNAGRGHVIYWLGLYKPIANAVWATQYAQSKVSKANCIKHIAKGLMHEASYPMQQADGEMPKVECRRPRAKRWMSTNQSGLGFISLIEVVDLPTY